MRIRVALEYLVFSALWLVFLPVAASAQPSVAPGETLAFTRADGGAATCRVLDAARSCTGPRFSDSTGSTRAEPGGNFVAAIIEPEVPLGLALPNYATAAVFNDFSVSGTDGVVQAQVSATWDYDSGIGGSAAYAADAILVLKVVDVTGAPIPIAAQTLTAQERSSDQGLELALSVGSQTAALRDENAGFAVALQRGRDYRLVFELQASISILIVGAPVVFAEASWSDLRISIDEDEFEQTAVHDAEVRGAIAQHDAEVKQGIATHDVDIKDAIARHDADIKALLTNLEEGQAEIIRLLLTPQGQRSSDFDVCGGDDCDFPLKPERGHGKPEKNDAEDAAPAPPPPAQPAPPAAEPWPPRPSWWHWGNGR